MLSSLEWSNGLHAVDNFLELLLRHLEWLEDGLVHLGIDNEVLHVNEMTGKHKKRYHHPLLVLDMDRERESKGQVN